MIEGNSKNGEQNLISQNLALQSQVDELSLQLRLQEQHLNNIDHPNHMVGPFLSMFYFHVYLGKCYISNSVAQASILIGILLKLELTEIHALQCMISY